MGASFSAAVQAVNWATRISMRATSSRSWACIEFGRQQTAGQSGRCLAFDLTVRDLKHRRTRFSHASRLHEVDLLPSPDGGSGFKAALVRGCEIESVAGVALDHGIDPVTIHRWIRDTRDRLRASLLI
jgi:hypothetical protein